MLERAPYDSLARLRAEEPVSWVPALGSWIVTGRDLAVAAMRDADAFTVDDPRFSTGAVLGPSMLSLEGPEHERHRAAFAAHFRPTVVREEFETDLEVMARELVAGVAADGMAELRRTIAGPLAVDTITRFLGLVDVEPRRVLEWYRQIADAIVGVAVGRAIPVSARAAIAELHERVAATLDSGRSDFLETLRAEAILRPEELPTAVAVVMFGAIETSEGMTANAFWHLLTHPEMHDAVRRDRSLVRPFIEESLRLEPAAAVVDRYATRDVRLGDVTIPDREMLAISLLGANRDPAVFPDPHGFDITRSNLRHHVTFVQGPHGCIGLHLARLETVAAVNAVLDHLPNLTIDAAHSTPPSGLIFRKPAAVTARWRRPNR